jgi:uncharacterized protein YggU (UPF0235/DUF167 family)
MLQKILVKPNKKADKVYYLQSDLFAENASCSDKILVVETAAPPLQGKANKKVIELVAKFLGVAKANISIKSGLQSKHKILEIKG